jgi:hypothetical protein
VAPPPTSAPIENPQEQHPPSASIVAVKIETPLISTQIENPSSAPVVAVEAGASLITETIVYSQEQLPLPAPITEVGAGMSATTSTTESSQAAHSKTAPIIVVGAETSSTTIQTEKSKEKVPTPALVNVAGAGTITTPATVENTQKKTRMLRRNLPQTPTQLVVAEAHHRKGTQSASIWQRNVQLPYHLRHKRKPSAAQLKGERVKTSFEKLMGPTDGSDGDFEELEELGPLLKSGESKEKEDSVADVYIFGDSSDRENRTIDSTDHIDQTITIDSTIVIGSTLSERNMPSLVPPDALTSENEAASSCR